MERPKLTRHLLVDGLKKFSEMTRQHLQCNICLDYFDDPVTTRCNHQFCRICILTALKDVGLRCPICKSRISKRSLVSRDNLGAVVNAVKKIASEVDGSVHLDTADPTKLLRTNAMKNVSSANEINSNTGNMAKKRNDRPLGPTLLTQLDREFEAIENEPIPGSLTLSLECDDQSDEPETAVNVSEGGLEGEFLLSASQITSMKPLCKALFSGKDGLQLPSEETTMKVKVNMWLDENKDYMIARDPPKAPEDFGYSSGSDIPEDSSPQAYNGQPAKDAVIQDNGDGQPDVDPYIFVSSQKTPPKRKRPQTHKRRMSYSKLDIKRHFKSKAYDPSEKKQRNQNENDVSVKMNDGSEDSFPVNVRDAFDEVVAKSPLRPFQTAINCATAKLSSSSLGNLTTKEEHETPVIGVLFRSPNKGDEVQQMIVEKENVSVPRPKRKIVENGRGNNNKRIKALSKNETPVVTTPWLPTTEVNISMVKSAVVDTRGETLATVHTNKNDNPVVDAVYKAPAEMLTSQSTTVAWWNHEMKTDNMIATPVSVAVEFETKEGEVFGQTVADDPADAEKSKDAGETPANVNQPTKVIEDEPAVTLVNASVNQASGAQESSEHSEEELSFLTRITLRRSIKASKSSNRPKVQFFLRGKLVQPEMDTSVSKSCQTEESGCLECTRRLSSVALREISIQSSLEGVGRASVHTPLLVHGVLEDKGTVDADKGTQMTEVTGIQDRPPEPWKEMNEADSVDSDDCVVQIASEEWGETQLQPIIVNLQLTKDVSPEKVDRGSYPTPSRVEDLSHKFNTEIENRERLRCVAERSHVEVSPTMDRKNSSTEYSGFVFSPSPPCHESTPQNPRRRSLMNSFMMASPAKVSPLKSLLDAKKVSSPASKDVLPSWKLKLLQAKLIRMLEVDDSKKIQRIASSVLSDTDVGDHLEEIAAKDMSISIQVSSLGNDSEPDLKKMTNVSEPTVKEVVPETEVLFDDESTSLLTVISDNVREESNDKMSPSTFSRIKDNIRRDMEDHADVNCPSMKETLDLGLSGNERATEIQQVEKELLNDDSSELPMGDDDDNPDDPDLFPELEAKDISQLPSLRDVDSQGADEPTMNLSVNTQFPYSDMSTETEYLTTQAFKQLEREIIAKKATVKLMEQQLKSGNAFNGDEVLRPGVNNNDDSWHSKKDVSSISLSLGDPGVPSLAVNVADDSQIPLELPPTKEELQAPSPTSTAATTKIPTRSHKASSHMVFVASGLSNAEQAGVKKMAEKFSAKMADVFTTSTTHVIIKTDEKKFCLRTLKYLMGVANHCYIVSYDWTIECLKSGRLVSEDDYEVVGEVITGHHNGPRNSRLAAMPLFRDHEFHCIGHINGISKDDWFQLLSWSGATHITDPSLFSYIPTRKSYIIVTQDFTAQRGYNKLYQRYRVQVLDRDWVLNSLSSYTLQPIEKFLLMNPAI